MGTRLEGKVAVITGGNSGIGLATAEVFVDAGAKVVLFGRDAGSLHRAVALLGANATGVRGDVTSGDDLEKLFEAVRQQHGGVDILFANAGVAEFLPLAAMTNEHFDKLFDINVKGVLQTVVKSQGVLRDGASIVLTTSGVNELGTPGAIVYSATKAAVRSFARTLSAELVGRGIRVNAVSPGPVATPIIGRMGLSDEQMKGLAAQMASQVPLKRMGDPSEIAKAVLFLASSDASFIVGAELVVDGGLTQL
jgi:NAD(P)-dependent dehydrogenase (short-subunit alcohol dehydrogenase family)